eukprot:1894096-Pleurochrysis_carterae.AAC.1
MPSTLRLQKPSRLLSPTGSPCPSHQMLVHQSEARNDRICACSRAVEAPVRSRIHIGARILLVQPPRVRALPVRVRVLPVRVLPVRVLPVRVLPVRAVVCRVHAMPLRARARHAVVCARRT